MQGKTELIDAINDNVSEVCSYVKHLAQQDIQHTKDNKWSIAENIIHLNKSVSPLNMALGLPKFTFIPFGKPKENLSYEDLIAKYQAKLKEGAVATGPYVPSEKSKNTPKEKLIQDFISHYSIFVKKLSKWSEEALDKYRLPHPIIGRITMREMTFFTIYHLSHHLNSIKNL